MFQKNTYFKKQCSKNTHISRNTTTLHISTNVTPTHSCRESGSPGSRNEVEGSGWTPHRNKVQRGVYFFRTLIGVDSDPKVFGSMTPVRYIGSWYAIPIFAWRERKIFTICTDIFPDIAGREKIQPEISHNKNKI